MIGDVSKRSRREPRGLPGRGDGCGQRNGRAKVLNQKRLMCLTVVPRRPRGRTEQAGGTGPPIKGHPLHKGEGGLGGPPAALTPSVKRMQGIDGVSEVSALRKGTV